MKSYVFKVEIEEDAFEDGRVGFHATCPALKGCHSWGHTRDEAFARIREAVELYVEDLVANGEPVPVDVEKGAVEVTSPAVLVNV